MQDKKSKKKENKRSIFQLCFPCIGKQTFSCDEVMCDSFGREFTEYEYVIENLAIRRAPKVLLDSALSAKKSKSKYGQTERVPVRNFGTSVERRSFPEVECGPVIEEQPSLMTPPNEKPMKTLNPTWTEYTPYKFTAPIERHIVRPIKRTKEKPIERTNEKPIEMPIVKPPASTMQNFTDAILLESPRQKKTVAQVYPVENDVKISPEVHKTDPRGADGAIPYDIKETIVALKNAQLPTSHKVRRARNHRTVLRGDSTTSFDDTICSSSEITDSNVSDITVKKFKNYLTKPTVYDNKVIEESDSLLQQPGKGHNVVTTATETSEELNVDKSVSTGAGPKWRIIINKHIGESKT